MRHHLRWRFLAVMAAMVCACAPPAHAHGFGQRFDLPLPLWLWVMGAGATVVVSFVVIAIFLREQTGRQGTARYALNRIPGLRWLERPFVVNLGRVAVTAAFLLTIAAGFWGNQDPYHNIIVTNVWIIWWVGFAFASVFLGNIWQALNPLAAIFHWAESARARPFTPRRPYPRKLGAWPAVALFLVFAWAELVWPEKDIPRQLAWAILVYSAIAWAGMLAFGPKAWIQNADAFTAAYGVLGGMAPIAAEQIGSQGQHLVFRPIAAGLLDKRPPSFSFMVFVIVMLSTVTFDGFLETPLFRNILNAMYTTPALTRWLYAVSNFGIEDTVLLKTLALIAFPTLFVGAYLVCSLAMALVTGRRGATLEIACGFVLTLVPISAAYHLSHYLSLLLTTGQFIIPLISDPFGFGWNLFSTAAYRVNLAVVGPRFYWYTAVALIVTGHVLAVYLAHVIALRTFGTRASALLSQLPMVCLMVAYTMLSLWILAQPIVG